METTQLNLNFNLIASYMDDFHLTIFLIIFLKTTLAGKDAGSGAKVMRIDADLKILKLQVCSMLFVKLFLSYSYFCRTNSCFWDIKIDYFNIRSSTTFFHLPSQMFKKNSIFTL